METLKKLGKTALSALCVAALVMLFLGIRHRIITLKNQVEQVTIAYNQLIQVNNDFINDARYLVTRLGDSLRMTGQIILSQKQAIDLGVLQMKELRDKHLKAVDNVVKLTEEIRILKQQGVWVDTVYIDTFENNRWLRIPADMAFSDNWYKLEVTADHTPLLNSLTVWSEPTITIGTVKEGIFKKPEKVTIYENANPSIQLKSIESLTIKEQDKWYQKTWFKVGAGFILGGFTVGIIQ